MKPVAYAHLRWGEHRVTVEHAGRHVTATRSSALEARLECERQLADVAPAAMAGRGRALPLHGELRAGPSAKRAKAAA